VDKAFHRFGPFAVAFATIATAITVATVATRAGTAYPH
jgi:hypothetical protein